MVAKVIREYLAEGKNKLTVPGFGTFMKRDSGNVIFVELLRTDDGILSELVEDTGNYSDVEAMALIDRFIFNVRKEIERHGKAVLEGFGEMTRDENGALKFTYQPARKPVPETARQERLFEEKEPAKRVVRRPAPRPKPSSRSKKTDTFIVIAVIAAAIAVIALAFGLSTGNMPFLK